MRRIGSGQRPRQCTARRPGRAPAPFDITTDRSREHSSLARAARSPDGHAPKIDGRLDDEVWTLAPVAGQLLPARARTTGSRRPRQTEFRVLYDDQTLYFGVWVWDSDPSGIMGSEMKRDAGLNKGDQLKITIDTFHDHRNAFYFSTNPLGAYKDANTVENGRTINYDWNAVWDNKTSIDDKGWYIEMAIPLNQLRFKTTIGESTWGFNLCRILFRKNEEIVLGAVPARVGRLGLRAHVECRRAAGAERHQVAPANRVRALRVAEAARDYLAAPDADVDAKYGGDFKIGVTDDLMADFTYHTDFAQVEADQEVVNLTRFSLFFPEKRQFFTESGGHLRLRQVGGRPGGDAAANDPGLLPSSTAAASAWSTGSRCRSSAAAADRAAAAPTPSA